MPSQESPVPRGTPRECLGWCAPRCLAKALVNFTDPNSLIFNGLRDSRLCRV